MLDFVTLKFRVVFCCCLLTIVVALVHCTVNNCSQFVPEDIPWTHWGGWLETRSPCLARPQACVPSYTTSCCCCCCLPCIHCSIHCIGPAYFVRTTNYSIITSPWLWIVAGVAYYVIQRNDTINDSIFHMSNGMQGAYSKMLGVVRI